MVLHVAGAALRRELPAFDLPAALELGEDRLVRPPHRVGQHVEPAAMRHPEDDVPGAGLGRALDRQIEHRHQHVHALDGEAFLAQVGLVQEALQRLDLGQPAQQPALLVGRGAACGRRRIRSSPGARPAPHGSRCARSRTPWFRSRSPGGRAAIRPGVCPVRPSGAPSTGWPP